MITITHPITIQAQKLFKTNQIWKFDASGKTMIRLIIRILFSFLLIGTLRSIERQSPVLAAILAVVFLGLLLMIAFVGLIIRLA